MERSNYRFTLDIRDSNGGCQLDMKRGDTHRRLQIALSDGGCPYFVTAECFPVLMAKTEDGSLMYSKCTVQNGEVLCDVTSAYTAVAGAVYCELRLYAADIEEEGTEGPLLTSATFVIRVHPTVYNGEDELYVAGTVEATALTQLVTEARAATDRAETAAQTLLEQRDNGEFDGTSLSHHWEGTTLVVTSASGTDTMDLQGPKGEKGEKGDTGPQGPEGTVRLDDTQPGQDPWSGYHTVEALCPPFSETGMTVTCTPVEKFPVTVKAEKAATVTLCGKNLFDPACKLNVGYIHTTTGTVAESGNYRYTDHIPAAHLVGKVITLNKTPGGNAPGMGFYAADGEYLGGSKGKAVTVPEKTHTLRFSLDKAAAEEGNIQLELGSVSTAYEAYSKETLSLTEEKGYTCTFPGRKGINNLFADTPLTVTGRADPIQELQTLKDLIRNFISTQ